MSRPIFILKSKTHYSDSSPGQIRVEFEPLVETGGDIFWADPKNPSGRCEFYIAPELDTNYPIGAKFQLQLIYLPTG